MAGRFIKVKCEKCKNVTHVVEVWDSARLGINALVWPPLRDTGARSNCQECGGALSAIAGESFELGKVALPFTMDGLLFVADEEEV